MSEDLSFEAFFGANPPDRDRGQSPDRIGMVVGGSISKGLEVKLDRSTMIEGVTVGRYVVVEGRKLRFFGMITDVTLDNTNPMLAKTPPDVSDPFLAEVYAGTSVYGRINVSPMLAFQEGEEPKPVKSLPSHFAAVCTASEEDVGRIFGRPDAADRRFFEVGEPLDMEGMKVYLDLGRFVERSSGVFGKSGTGKTFLTRLLLAGIVQGDVAVNLIFDMHNEYGWESQAEGGSRVKGLKQLFESRVSIFTLDDESSRRRGIRPDFVVQIAYEQVEPADIEMLGDLLGLTEAQVSAIFSLGELFGQAWLQRTLDLTQEEIDDLARSHGQHAGTLAALKRKLERFKRFSFLVPQAENPSVQHILEYLNNGQHVVLEFGRYGSDLSAYLLVANYLTRRIHEAYVRRKEDALGNKAEEPRALVITIEEAHKFLDPRIASQTIFGIIARELRKYNVTLLVVDQRPSGIDEEVMSQIGTRVTCLLDNERDIQAVLTGISGAGELRNVLARLDTKQQALLLGHAVKMPVVIKTRTYGTADFYRSLGVAEGEQLQAKLEQNRRLMRGEDEDDGLV
ncbi:MAG: ATP-binding protein [Chloroflexi bacterium]|nr:ATP-binding protein [Chloroflexota bacterium]